MRALAKSYAHRAQPGAQSIYQSITQASNNVRASRRRACDRQATRYQPAHINILAATGDKHRQSITTETQQPFNNRLSEHRRRACDRLTILERAAGERVTIQQTFKRAPQVRSGFVYIKFIQRVRNGAKKGISKSACKHRL